jgi:hypothetical protein
VRRPAAVIAACAVLAAPAQAAPAVHLGVRLGVAPRGAAAPPLRIRLTIDTRRAVSPATALSLLLPRGFEPAASGLGIAECRLPLADLADVILHGPPPSCSPNAVLGRGSASAEVRLSESEVLRATGIVTVLAGAPRDGRPGVVAMVTARHPVRATLAYAGVLFEARPPFGAGMRVAMPPIPRPPLDATVALTSLSLTIGGRDLRYRRRVAGRWVRYHPDGIPLPGHCPRRGWPFLAGVAFADGTSRWARARLPCPRH